jgi:hypothetical protein
VDAVSRSAGIREISNTYLHVKGKFLPRAAAAGAADEEPARRCRPGLAHDPFVTRRIGGASARPPARLARRAVTEPSSPREEIVIVPS